MVALPTWLVGHDPVSVLRQQAHNRQCKSRAPQVRARPHQALGGGLQLRLERRHALLRLAGGGTLLLQLPLRLGQALLRAVSARLRRCCRLLRPRGHGIRLCKQFGPSFQPEGNDVGLTLLVDTDYK